jgi:hypothetical protein
MRQMSCFLVFVKNNLQNSFTADAENVHHLLEDKPPPEILLPVGVLLSYSVLFCLDKNC